jgi:hypothetical protein
MSRLPTMQEDYEAFQDSSGKLIIGDGNHHYGHAVVLVSNETIGTFTGAIRAVVPQGL